MSAVAEGRTTFERALTRRAQQSVADENARAEELLHGGGRAGRAGKHRRPVLGKVLLALAVAGVLKLVLFSAQGSRGTRPLNAVALASADGTGLGSSPVGFLTEPSPAAPPPVTTATFPRRPSSASSPGFPGIGASFRGREASRLSGPRQGA